MLRKVPGWLTDRWGPLRDPPSYFPQAAAVAVALDRGEPDAPRLADLGRDARACTGTTFDCWRELLGPRPDFADLIRPHGQVHVWERRSETPDAAIERSLRRATGDQGRDRSTADDLRQMFPGDLPDDRRAAC